MHISRCLLMRGLVRSYHQALVGGGGGEEKERLDTAPQNSVATTPPTHNSIVIILLLIKNHENIYRILAAIEHEFSVVSIAETWKRSSDCSELKQPDRVGVFSPRFEL